MLLSEDHLAVQDAVRAFVRAEVAPHAAACGRIDVVSVAPVFAQAISSIHSHDSVSRLFR